jgi:putative PEP-CTERM system histidine kinase
MENYALSSYLLASIAFAGLLILSLWVLNKNTNSIPFLIAVFFSFLWACYSCYVLYDDDIYTPSILPFETLRNLSWFYFLLTIIFSYKENQQSKTGKVTVTVAKRMWQSKYVVALAITGLCVLVIELFPQLHYSVNQLFSTDLRLFFHVSFAIIGLILVEQLYRNTLAENRWTIKFICLGLGALFVYDFIIYSKSMLFSDVDVMLWSARGVVNAMIVPLLAISVIRFQEGVHTYTISRKIVFHTTSLVATGFYLILMSLAGFYIKKYGGNWGEFAQILFIFFGILILFILLFSGTIRAIIKVYFNKHFVHYHYDYREEWINLSKKLSQLKSFNELSKVVIKTLADLVDSSGGGLWLKNEKGDFYLAEEISLGFQSMKSIAATDPVIKFWNNKQWVIDLFEYNETPEVYDEFNFSHWQVPEKNIWLLIPLLQQNELEALVILTKPRVARRLNWEDHDLLKTVGMQLTNALVLGKASEELSTARQFEAYSRLSAFMLHDLKNLVAQVSLIVKNAEKHKHNPAFIEDTIETLENVVTKMHTLVSQLKNRNFQGRKSKIDLVNVINDAVKQQSANKPLPEFKTELQQCYVVAEAEKITAILGHLIQNAQDATVDDGYVKISLADQTPMAVIKITDNGTGMDEKFISERLFKPFDTTKGNAGMGIGVYEAKNYIQTHAGKIAVESEVNEGTTFIIELPIMNIASSLKVCK